MPGSAARPFVADDDDVAGLDRLAAAPRRTPLPRCRTRAPARDASCARCPTTFITAPSGARLPRRITRPPRRLERLVERPHDFLPRRFDAPSAASSPSVRPVTVGAAPSSTLRPRAAAARPAALPPAACRSVATKRPDGLRSASSGVRALMRSKSSSVERRRRLRARSRAGAARRWSSRRSPPPTAIAFSNAARVMMSRGRTPLLRPASIDALAGARARRRPSSGSVAGTLPLPSAAMPRNSQAIAIVLAVNWPPHAPAPGHALIFELAEARRRSSCPRRARRPPRTLPES